MNRSLAKAHADKFDNLGSIWDYREICDYAAYSWMHPDDRDVFFTQCGIDNLVSHLSQDSSYEYGVRGFTPEGELCFKQLQYSYLDRMGEEILVRQMDVTQTLLSERENTERLQTALEDARNANTAKSEFLSSMSHDMRTPLNGVIGYTRLALESDDADAIRGYLEKTEGSAKVLLALINDTLDLSKIETGKVTLKPEPVAGEALVEYLLTSVLPSIDEKHIRLILDTDLMAGVTVNLDVLRMSKIFLNLLNNAIKFTPEGGRIELSVECLRLEEDRVYDRITVSDNGIGMSNEFLPKVFEPFAQERTSKTAQIGGLGLGLAIVRQLVELMGGRIEVESELGVGTTFTIWLDFERVDAAVPLEKEPVLEQDALLEKTILLVEDNAMNAEIATVLLETYGAEVITAMDGQQAIERFEASEAGTFDAVLMDIRMPVMDGHTATRAIRASGRPDAKTIPIIAMSADAYDSDVRRSMESGMNAHLAKPIDPESVLDAITRFCE